MTCCCVELGASIIYFQLAAPADDRAQRLTPLAYGAKQEFPQSLREFLNNRENAVWF